MQRRSASAAKTLDPNASDRALRLVSVTSQAIDVLGSQEAAERWLASPAMGLDRRKPIDLLQSTEGTEMIKTLLTRMDYGVYA
jgi:putative toxin-antitoxin system antitoxin component (TIGR02293 family)